MIQIDASNFAQFEISEFEISRFDCSSFILFCMCSYVTSQYFAYTCNATPGLLLLDENLGFTTIRQGSIKTTDCGKVSLVKIRTRIHEYERATSVHSRVRNKGSK